MPRSRAVHQFFEIAILQMLIEPPALDLLHHFVELRFLNRLIHEPLTAGETAEVPLPIREFFRHAVLP